MRAVRSGSPAHRARRPGGLNQALQLHPGDRGTDETVQKEIEGNDAEVDKKDAKNKRKETTDYARLRLLSQHPAAPRPGLLFAQDVRGVFEMAEGDVDEDNRIFLVMYAVAELDYVYGFEAFVV